jgi:hypothetical protein
MSTDGTKYKVSSSILCKERINNLMASLDSAKSA